MAPLIVFAFGPNEGFLLDVPVTSQWRRLGRTFEQLRPTIQTYYHLCLGPGDNEYAAFYINKNNLIEYSLNFPEEDRIIKPVTEWLKAVWKAQKWEDILRSRLIIGPDSTFLAITPFDIRWGPENCFPSSLRDVLDEYGNQEGAKPLLREAALGANGAWWIRFEDGALKWDLAGGYSQLETLLSGGAIQPKSVDSLVLSPYSTEHYFLVYDRSKVRYALPAQFDKLIAPVLRSYHDSIRTVSGVFDWSSTTEDGEASRLVADEQPPPYAEGSTGRER